MHTLAILIICIPLPLLIVMHYMTRWKQNRELTNTDETMLEDLWTTAQKMESRINALETILDDSVPHWREKV